MLGLDRLLQKSPGTIAQNLLQGVIPVWCIECNDITITQAVYSSVGCDPARSSNKIHRSPLSSYTRNDHISATLSPVEFSRIKQAAGSTLPVICNPEIPNQDPLAFRIHQQLFGPH